MSVPRMGSVSPLEKPWVGVAGSEDYAGGH